MAFEHRTKNSTQNLGLENEDFEVREGLKGVNSSVYSKQSKNFKPRSKQSRSPRYRSPIQCRMASEYTGKVVCPTCEKRLGTGVSQTFHLSPPKVRPSHHNVVCDECSQGSYSKILKVICLNEPQSCSSETKKIKITEYCPENSSTNSFSLYGSGQTFQVLHEEVLLPPKPELTSLAPNPSKENHMFRFQLKEEERKRVAIRRAEYANRMKGLTKTIITTYVPGEEPKRIIRQSSLDSEALNKKQEKPKKSKKIEKEEKNEEKRGKSVERGRVRERLVEEKSEKNNKSRETRMKYLQQIRDESLKRNLEQSKVSVKHKILAKLAEKDFAHLLENEEKAVTGKSEEGENEEVLLISENSWFYGDNEAGEEEKVGNFKEDKGFVMDLSKSSEKFEEVWGNSGDFSENKENTREIDEDLREFDENIDKTDHSNEKIENYSADYSRLTEDYNEKTLDYSEKTEDYSENSEQTEKITEKQVKIFSLLVGKCLKIEERPENSEDSRGKSDEGRVSSHEFRSKVNSEDPNSPKNLASQSIPEEIQQSYDNATKSPDSPNKTLNSPDKNKDYPLNSPETNKDYPLNSFESPSSNIKNYDSSSEENVEFCSSLIEESIRNESPQLQDSDHPMESFEVIKKKLEYTGNHLEDSPHQELTSYENQMLSCELTSQLTQELDPHPCENLTEQYQLLSLIPTDQEHKIPGPILEKIRENLEKEEGNEEFDLKSLTGAQLNAFILALTDPKVLKGLRLLGGFADYLEKDGKIVLDLD